MAILSQYNIDGNSDILLPYWITFNSHLAQYKNKTCEHSSKVTKEDFEENDQNLEIIFADFAKNSPAYRSEKTLKAYQKNIYYDDIECRNDFEIIGADMSCGSWNHDLKGFNRIYYWQWPFKKD
jgi:hypothetical protein